MKEVELKIITNQSSAVNSVRELATESKKLYDNNEVAQKRQVGLIADIEKELGRLQTAQKNAMTVENITKYNQKIAEAKQSLDEYNKAGVAVQKQGDSMMQSIGKWALGFASVATAVRLLKEGFQATEDGLRTFNVVGAITKQLIYDLVSGNAANVRSIALSLTANKMAEEERIRHRTEIVEIAKAQTVYNKLYFEASNHLLTDKQRIQVLDQAMLAHNVLVAKQIALAQDELTVIQFGLIARPKETKLLDAEAAKLAELESLRGEEFSQTKRLEMTRTSLQEQEINKRKEILKKGLDEQKKLQEDYQKAVNALIDKYNSLGIESLSGVDKLKAQRDFAINEIDILKTHLTSFGPITEGQQNMILKMVDDVQAVFIRGMEKEAKLSPQDKDAISKALLSSVPTLADLNKKGLAPTNTVIPSKPLSSIWQLIGIDPETDDGKKEIEAIKKVYDTTIQTLDSIYKAKVEDATRLRELADTKVSDAESALNTEVELYKAGYASNVAAKQKELDDLKAQRDVAQRNEADAVKKQRALDTVTQVSSLLTATANIFKGFSTMPIIGQILSIAAIAAMFGAFAIAKTQAANATRLASGGHGEVDGRLHSQGGERFLDHVEVEQGEKWGVLSRGASRKYGSTFYRMVDSFNRDSLTIPKQGVINNILLDTSMTNERLDELIQLNKKERKEEIIIMNGMTIYKKGSTIRTIKR